MKQFSALKMKMYGNQCRELSKLQIFFFLGGGGGGNKVGVLKRDFNNSSSIVIIIKIYIKIFS